MPDRGDERGRGGTRTLVTGILADTEWHPATNPQEATQTARDARDLAVRLRPVLSKLAQTPRGGRRRDLDWLPAVEQLAVDAQYFASWWLPRLEGKSAQSWPSWSADGYADWVKRLDAQRLRTLEMVQGTAPVTRIASVTQLRRGKNEAEQEREQEAETQAVQPGPGPEAGAALDGLPAASGSEERPESPSHARHGRHASEPPEGTEKERTARITPLRGPGAALMDAALLDMTGAAGAAGASSGRTDESEPSRPADTTAKGNVGDVDEDVDDDVSAIADNADRSEAATDVALPPVPRTPPNQGPVDDGPQATRGPRSPVGDEAEGYGNVSADAAKPKVPHTPPNQGPAAEDAGVGADILQIPRTPPNSGPANADPDVELSRTPRRAPVVSLVGESDRPRVPRTPPNPGPGAAGDDLAAEKDAESTHVSLAPVSPAALGAGALGAGALGAGAAGAAALGPKALGSGSETKTGTKPGAETGTGTKAGPGTGSGTGAGTGTGSEVQTRPLFRPEPSAAALAGAAGAGAAAGAAAAASTAAPSKSAASTTGIGAGHNVGSGTYGTDGPSQPDEFENFQPGSDLPPPIFPMTEPIEPVDRGRIVRFAAAAVVLAAAGVAVFVAATQKSSEAKTASPLPATSSASSTAQPSSADAPSSSISGAVTAPTATDAPPVSSTAAKPAPPPPKPSTPSSTAPKTTDAPSHTSAAPPPPVSRQPPPAGGVSSLRITSLAADATGGYNYVAHVHVTTNGTGTVTIMVTFAGTSSSGSPGSVGAETLPFTMSGKTSYDFVAQTDVHSMCQPSQPYIDAVASASGAGSSVAYASSPC